MEQEKLKGLENVQKSDHLDGLQNSAGEGE